MEIRNRFLSAVINACDLPVRFLYTQTGPVARALHRALSPRLYHSGIREADTKFRAAIALLSEAGVDVRGASVLELGPGDSRACAYQFLRHGAKRVVLVDKFPRPLRGAPQPELDRSIVFHAADVADLVGSEKVDLIYSMSVLEHIREPDVAIAAMARILRPGGHMYHLIDMRDHYNFASPFLFYKYSDVLWENYLTKEGLSYTNRWRYRQYHDVFAAHGLEVLKEEIASFPLASCLRLNKRFQGRDDTHIGIVSCVLKKI